MLVWIRDTYGGRGEAESGVEVRVFVEFGVLLVDSVGCVRCAFEVEEEEGRTHSV